MPTPCTLIANAVPNPEHMEDMKAYLQQSGPLLNGLGGSAPKRMKVTHVINGESVPALVLVMGFPDRDALSAVFESEAYKALIPTRDRGFLRMDIFIGEPM